MVNVGFWGDKTQQKNARPLGGALMHFGPRATNQGKNQPNSTDKTPQIAPL